MLRWVPDVQAAGSARPAAAAAGLLGQRARRARPAGLAAERPDSRVGRRGRTRSSSMNQRALDGVAVAAVLAPKRGRWGLCSMRQASRTVVPSGNPPAAAASGRSTVPPGWRGVVRGSEPAELQRTARWDRGRPGRAAATPPRRRWADARPPSPLARRRGRRRRRPGRRRGRRRRPGTRRPVSRAGSHAPLVGAARPGRMARRRARRRPRWTFAGASTVRATTLQTRGRPPPSISDSGSRVRWPAPSSSRTAWEVTIRRTRSARSRSPATAGPRLAVTTSTRRIRAGSTRRLAASTPPTATTSSTRRGTRIATQRP